MSSVVIGMTHTITIIRTTCHLLVSTDDSCLDSVKTLQSLGMLNVSVVAVGARVQWFNGSVVQRRA